MTAVVIGDMIDNLVWGEVSVAMFVVAVVVLFATHWTIEGLWAKKILKFDDFTCAAFPEALRRVSDLLAVERPVAVTLRLDRPLVAFQRA